MEKLRDRGGLGAATGPRRRASWRARAPWRVRTPRRAAVVALAAVLGLALLPVTAAQAATWRSATSTGWGPSPSAGKTNASNNAISALNSLAASYGETCTSVTVSTPRHLYTAPDGSAWIYEATATGYCSP